MKTKKRMTGTAIAATILALVMMSLMWAETAQQQTTADTTEAASVPAQKGPYTIEVGCSAEIRRLMASGNM